MKKYQLKKQQNQTLGSALGSNFFGLGLLGAIIALITGYVPEGVKIKEKYEKGDIRKYASYIGNGDLSYAPKNGGKEYTGQGKVLYKIPERKLKESSVGGSSYMYHYINRVMGRSVSTDDIYKTVRNPIVVLSQWNDERYLYISEVAAVALDKDENFLTAWSRNEFGLALEQILKEAKEC